MENLLAIPFKCLEVPKADIEECVVLTIINEKLQLTEREIDIILFLKSLTGKTAELGRLGIPDKVPSGLSID